MPCPAKKSSSRITSSFSSFCVTGVGKVAASAPSRTGDRNTLVRLSRLSTFRRGDLSLAPPVGESARDAIVNPARLTLSHQQRKIYAVEDESAGLICCVLARASTLKDSRDGIG